MVINSSIFVLAVGGTTAISSNTSYQGFGSSTSTTKPV